jgi:hypothetical protein
VSDIDPEELVNAVRDAVAGAEEQEVTFGRNCAVPIKDGDLEPVE